MFTRTLPILLAAMAVACSKGTTPPVESPDASPGCVPGMSVPCTCSDGRNGAQICRPDQTFTACTCGSPTSCTPGTTGACTCNDGTMGQATCAMDGKLGACTCTINQPDGGMRPMQCSDPNAVATVQDGECCVFSINCLPGSICNDPSEMLFDPSKPLQTCVRVVCNSDLDCSNGKTCSLSRLCMPRVCQLDTDCAAPTLCIGGTCTPPPPPLIASSCRIMTLATALLTGGAVDLVAVALDPSGRVIPKVQFQWTSSDPGVVSVMGSQAIGGGQSGVAHIGASVVGNPMATCPPIDLVNFTAVPMGRTRVVAALEATGSPISGAKVTLIAGTQTASAATDATGAAIFSSAPMIDSVTVEKAGLASVTVLQPGTSDVFVTLPALEDITRSGGWRGSIDLTETPRADIQVAFAGRPLPPALIDFERASIFGPGIRTVIDAPELGLNNQRALLPGGYLLSLGNKHFTDDSAMPGGGVRCQGMMPMSGSLGCAVVASPQGSSAAWAIGGQVRLSQFTAIATQLSSAFGNLNAGRTDLASPLFVVHAALFSGLRHAAFGLVPTAVFPNVPVDPASGADCTNARLPDYTGQCRGNFSQFSPVGLLADAPAAIQSVVTVPMLPALVSTPGCAKAAMLVLLAHLPGRGFIPLGVSVGFDSLNGDAPDCIIDGAPKPFGDNSVPLPNGQMPLSAAPPHDGLEDSSLRLLLFTFDPDPMAQGTNRVSALVSPARTVPRMTDLGLPFLPYPGATRDRPNGRVQLPAPDPASDGTRLIFDNGSARWIVYAPAVFATITLPMVTGPRAIFSDPAPGRITVFAAGGYSNLWTLGSQFRIDNLGRQLRGYASNDLP